MKKIHGAVLALSIVSTVLSAAALVIGIIALVKSAGRNRIADVEYDFYSSADMGNGDDDSSEEENIGSDTLAF